MPGRDGLRGFHAGLEPVVQRDVEHARRHDGHAAGHAVGGVAACAASPCRPSCPPSMAPMPLAAIHLGHAGHAAGGHVHPELGLGRLDVLGQRRAGRAPRPSASSAAPRGSRELVHESLHQQWPQDQPPSARRCQAARSRSIRPLSSSSDPNWMASSPISSTRPWRLTRFFTRTSTCGRQQVGQFFFHPLEVARLFLLAASAASALNSAPSFLTRLSASRTDSFLALIWLAGGDLRGAGPAPAARARGPCRGRRPSAWSAPDRPGSAGAAGCWRRCASGPRPARPVRASGRTRRSGAAGPAPLPAG